MAVEVCLAHASQQALSRSKELLATLFQQGSRVRGGLQNEGHVADGQVTGCGQEHDVPELLLRSQLVEGFLLGAPDPELCHHVPPWLIWAYLHRKPHTAAQMGEQPATTDASSCSMPEARGVVWPQHGPCQWRNVILRKSA